MISVMNSLIEEFQARVYVNKFLNGFFDISDKNEFINSSMGKNLSDGSRILRLIKNHIANVGSFPVIEIKDNNLRSGKEISLMMQLQVDLFRHKFEATVELKLDNKDNILIKVMNIDNVPLSILSTELLTDESLSFSNEINYEVNLKIYDVDMYNARLRENGKKLNCSESKFGEFFEELFTVQYYKTDSNLSETLITEDKFESVPFSELNSFSIMNTVLKDNDLSKLFSEAVNASKDFKYIKRQEKESEHSF
jgi:hypothetical protein